MLKHIGSILLLGIIAPVATAASVTMTCDGSQGFPYDEATAKKATYTLWLSADRKEASMTGRAMGVHKFPISEVGDDMYSDDITTLEKGKPDLEFFINRDTLQVLYNRGYASGERIYFFGECRIKQSRQI